MHELLKDQRFQGSGMTSQRARDRLMDVLRRQGIRNEKVLEVMRYLPRHIFVDEAMSSHAYDNHALPIGYNQTISQPYIVARMTETLLAQTRPGRILEVGTGCGYQTAVLAPLVKQVYSVERLQALSRQAGERLRALGLRNVSLKHGDGFLGWPEHAPFDGILVTAAPEQIPEALLSQLANPGGVMIIPVGPRNHIQMLQQITRTRHGFDTRTLDSVGFVPMLDGVN